MTESARRKADHKTYYLQDEESAVLSCGEVEPDEPLGERKPRLLKQRTCCLKRLVWAAGASSNAKPLRNIGPVMCEIRDSESA